MKTKSTKRKSRFFNRPIKIGVGVAGFGASVEFGSIQVYELIQDYPKLIFWLEVLKYASYIIGVLFASGGVIRQAKEDMESIKLGEQVKEVVEKDIDLKAKPEDTKVAENENLKDGFNFIGEMAKDFILKRKAKRNE